MAVTRNGRVRGILVTGGAGFVGSNLVALLLEDTASRVVVFDKLSRPGVEHNLAWLRSLPQHGRLTFVHGDVRSAAQLADAVRDVDEIYHLAAQVAVTTSIDDPWNDFETNALGTVNVLEAARRGGRKPMVLYTSTNKVYGGLKSVTVHEQGQACRADDPLFRGADEAMPLDFHSPYGCSKGAADQYVRDYARIYDLPTVVFRMSCIAGPRQFGNEDQGWVAHFLYSVLAGKSITIYGTGRQVRDVLHVHDLVDAMAAARNHLPMTAGETYNIGGGLSRSASVLEMLTLVERLTGVAPRVSYAGVRPGDQPLYISDTAKFEAHTGWQPSRSLPAILGDIHSFWQCNRELITDLAAQAARSTIAVETEAELVEDEVA